MKTVLITGSSSGIGKETAKLFQKKGWNVAATMRSPEKENELNNLENVKCFKLDVTDKDSIETAIEETIRYFEGIDVVVNNAGYGTKGLFEAANKEEAKDQFEVNVFGVMNVMWAILPYFRSKKDGTIINISSQSGVVGAPLNSIYNSTKFAIEGISESLMYELSAINVKIKLVLLSAVKSNFLSSTRFFKDPDLVEYSYFNNNVMSKMKEYLANGERPEVIAKDIYKAVSDGKNKLRYLAGNGVKPSYLFKKVLPFNIFKKIVYRRFGLVQKSN
ncbi:SDR family NAD(P)-dependent oxidoreductase [Iocasia frigidifontis]|uniref:SDR family NAD(P)-dependent oxidoreductase n=1 Tax=Iocasia fonsfrigidae TaxID=2682810 RepID=A0A8A7KCN3_9FIRM|nr:SDR family oxidoreductase [Iocasia fonsfrigidae]QTL99010.1 SDR family NAD(P)-dependent oxidoreductase [Iocasia fonsfrigidae]